MNRIKIYRRTVLVLALLWLVALAMVLHSRYRTTHPPTTSHVAGKCAGPGLVAHWKFDEVIDDMTPDAGPYGHHGKLALAPRAFAPLRFDHPKLVPGLHGQALEFGGKHWIAAGNNDCLASEQFTVAAWVWLAETADVPTIAAKSTWGRDGWWLCTTTKGAQADDRYLDFGIALGEERNMHVESGYQLPLREWHHVVASLDNTRGEAQFFIDGKPYGTKKTGIPRWLVNRDHDLFVAEYDGSARWPWKGKLDDVRFYNFVLSADAVGALYAQRTLAAHDVRAKLE
jgi:hypothetical protein